MKKIFGINISRSLLIRLVLILILFISGTFVFFNLESLSESPLNKKIEFDEPLYAIRTESGKTVVSDSLGSRILFVSKDMEIEETVSYHGLYDYTPSFVESMASDGDLIYILDRVISESGNTYSGDRILVYDQSGNYVKTLLTTDEIKETDRSYRIYNISAEDGRVYAVLYDDLDELAERQSSKSLFTAEITDGRISLIHTYSTGDTEIYDAFYVPSSDTVTAVAYDGTLFIGKEDKIIRKELKGSDINLDDVFIFSDGRMMALDQSNNTIAYYSDNMEKEVIVETAARNFTVFEDLLIYTDPDTYTLHFVDLNNKTEKVYDSLPYSQRIMAKRHAVWMFLIIGSVSLLGIAYFAVKDIIKLISSAESISGLFSVQKGYMTTAGLYGRMFAILIIVFSVTALLFGTFYYTEMIEKSEANVVNAIYGLRGISKDSYGNFLSKFDSQDDFGSEEYKKIEDFTEYICMTGVKRANSIDLICKVYRFNPENENVMVCIDPSDSLRCGTVLLKEEQEANHIYNVFSTVRTGNVAGVIDTYNNGTVYYSIYGPVFDENGDVVGAVTTIMNETVVSAKIMDKAMTKLLEIFTLLSGMLMVAAESNFLVKVFDIKRKHAQNGDASFTPAEVSRPIEILFSVPYYGVTLFITLSASSILSKTGQTGTVLLALPLTVAGISFALSNTILGPAIKYNPKLSMIISALIEAFAGVMGIIASESENFQILCVSAALAGAGFGMGTDSKKTIQFSGKVPEDSNKFMIYTGMEASIACAIAGAFGSVIHGSYGDRGLMIFVTVSSLLAIPVIMYFVDNNEIRTERSMMVKSKFENLKDNLGFILRPDIVIILFCAILPMGFMKGLLTYVLPLYNQGSGSPDMFIGAITLLVQFTCIFFIPQLLKLIVKSKWRYSTWICIGLLTLAVSFTIFAYNNSYRSFIPLLILAEIWIAEFSSMADDINIAEAGNAGVAAGDTDVYIEMFNDLGEELRTVVFSLMLVGGNRNFGITWAFGCLAFAVLVLCVRKISKNVYTNFLEE